MISSHGERNCLSSATFNNNGLYSIVAFWIPFNEKNVIIAKMQ